MQFVLLIHENETTRSDRPQADRDTMYAEYMAYTKELVAAGAMRGGDALMPSAKGVFPGSGSICRR